MLINFFAIQKVISHKFSSQGPLPALHKWFHPYKQNGYQSLS